MKQFEGQRQRIFDALKSGNEIAAVELHRIGSGKENGWCASFSRRISEIRAQLKLESKDVVCRKEIHDGQLQTFYKIVSCFSN